VKAKDYKFCEKVGPGGIKCPCCGDKGSKKRANRKFRRTKKNSTHSPE
jgi:hypothetical protein